MQILTWMLIALHGGLSTPVAAPVWADYSNKSTAGKQCPALQPPPFSKTSVTRTTSRVGTSMHADRSFSAPTLASASHTPSIMSSDTPTQVPLATTVSFELRVGRLKPQVETLLREHFAVQHMVWNAPEGLLWPSDFKLQARDATAIVESLLQPYNLQMRVYANHTAVIYQLAQGAEL